MPLVAEQVDSLIAAFRNDLGVLSDENVVHKHILTGSSVVVAEAAYFEIRSKTAEEFNICPSEVLMVGSCKTGFSLKDAYPYRHARIDSDIDVAIVSEGMFQEYWEAVFHFANQSHEFRNSRKYDTFARDLFSGWIMPRGLPKMTGFPGAERWQNFFRKLGNQRLHGPEARNINARIYRSWRRLQAYQEKTVRKRRRDTESSNR